MCEGSGSGFDEGIERVIIEGLRLGGGWGLLVVGNVGGDFLRKGNEW